MMATIARRRPLPWAGLILVAVALALRAHRLAAQSLWSDEDITLDRALSPLAAMLRGLPVEQGPLYYALMRPWTLLAGSSDLALRWPSLLASVIAVPLAMHLGRQLAGRRAGRLLGLIAAVNPFLVYYGQEARGYALLWCLALATPLALLHAERTGRRSHWLLTGALAAATVLTHAYGLLALVPLLLWPFLSPRPTSPSSPTTASAPPVPFPTPTPSVLSVPSILSPPSPPHPHPPPRPNSPYLLAALTAALLYAPWLPRALGILGHQGWREGWPLAGAAWANLGAWSAGTRADWSPGPPAPSPLGTAVYLVLALTGLVALVRSATTRRGAEDPCAPYRELRSLPVQPPAALHASRALTLGLLPPLAYALILAATSHPGSGGQRLADYDPRYFMAGLGGFYLLAAVGGAALGRRWQVAAAGLIAAGAVLPLRGLYGDPAYQKPDYRALMARVAATARDPSTQPVLYPSSHDEDTVLLLDGPSEGLARRYRTDAMPVKVVRLPDGADDVARDTTLERLDALAGEYVNVWLVEDGQARGWASAWLDARAYPVMDSAMQDWRLRRFLLPPDEAQADARTRSGPAAGPGTPSARSLDGALAVAIDAPSLVGTAGEVVALRFGWSAATGRAVPARLSIRLRQASGSADASAAAAADRPILPWWPQRAAPSPEDLAPPWLDRHGLALPKDLAPGSYLLEFRAYDPREGGDGFVDRLVTSIPLRVDRHLPDELPASQAPPPAAGPFP